MFLSTRWRALLVGAVAAGMATIGIPATAAPAAPNPFTMTGTHTITLITGDQVTVTTSANGTPTFLTRSGTGFASFTDATGDHYIVPALALPYLGKQLDLSLFDVSALNRDGVTGKLPVHLAFTSGVTPTAPAGVTLTSVNGGTADGYVAAGNAFTAALHQRLAADIAAGHQAGSSGIADGLTGISLAAAGPAPVVRPFFPLHILQITGTDLTGQPADLPVFLINTDAIKRETAVVPVLGGIGRVAVPAGNYAAFGFFADIDAQGNPTALRMVTEDDFAVANAPTTSTVTVDERTATSVLSGTTPRPTTADLESASVARFDLTGQPMMIGVGTFDPTKTPIYVNPQAAPTNGTLRYLAEWGGAATTATDGYRYDLALAANDIPADESMVARPDQLATLHEHFFTDPAGGTSGLLLIGAVDPALVQFGFSASSVPQTMPGDLTDYVATNSDWVQLDALPNGNFLLSDPHAYAARHAYSVDWARGPVAAGLGQQTGLQFCNACTAGSTLSLAIPMVRDSVPDHTGFLPLFTPAGLHFTLFQGDTKVFDQDGAFGGAVTNIPAVPTTYRGVLDVDLTADPTTATTFSQSTKTHTEVTVQYDPTATGNPLPTTDFCQDQTPTTPCRILPALTLDYQLAVDKSNTSHSPVETLGLRVGHVSYDGVGSHSPITSATVSVSFDNGTTWHPATMAGFAGHYFALWHNPTTGSPMLRVTATDAAGDAISQTITNAYTIGTVGAGR